MDYALRDFLMFTPEVYLRLFIRFNEALWPWPLVFPVALAALAGLLSLPQGRARRLGLSLLAVGWVLTALLFLQRYYQPIHWGMTYAVWGFLGQAVLLALLAWRVTPNRIPLGVGLLGAVAVMGLSTASALSAGTPEAMGWPGLTPDATVLLTVMALLAVPWKPRCVLLVVPVLWLLTSALTQWALELRATLLPPVVGLGVALLGLWPGSRRRSRRRP
ncbi:hypothetical protein EZI54_05505 [Marinobacter halodurans]|uniref:MFS transporter permease n=1 Tax=Marinobacter halodurans TaxID=2528979 RepID=A0ABY1ZN49_9GAMM|nr:hypothetical protein [Marinobacter halodurans]TBW57910.1 hypothetical protein EZI54_05505 [Marinobacter halodurans]